MRDQDPNANLAITMEGLVSLPDIRTAPFRPLEHPFSVGRLITLRRGEYLETRHDCRSSVFVVVSGVIILETLLPDGRRQVVGFRLPGELLCLAFNQILPGNGARAGADVQLQEIRYDGLGGASSDDGPAKVEPIADRFVELAAIQFERHALHNLVLGRLKPEERVASLMLELALLCGRGIQRGIAFHSPLGRSDAADYLCLNADTYSRTLSQLRRDAIIEEIGNGDYRLVDLEGLCKRTPLASAIIDRYAKDAGQQIMVGNLGC